MIKASTHSAVNLVGILIAYLGLSPIKLLSPVPLISAVRFVYQGLIFDIQCPYVLLAQEPRCFWAFLRFTDERFPEDERSHLRVRFIME